MIEIRHFETTDAYDAIPKALKIAKKDKCRIDLTIFIPGYDRIVPITIKIGEKDKVEQLIMRFKETLDIVRIKPVSYACLFKNKKFPQEVCDRLQSEIGRMLPNGSSVRVYPSGVAAVQLPFLTISRIVERAEEGLLDTTRQYGKFRIYTRLQDEGWEFCREDEFDTLPEAERKVVGMIRGPLGGSCMYEIRQGNRTWRSNSQCFGLAHLNRRKFLR